MSEVSSTEAARSFSDILDAVEHRGEGYTIVRRGRAVAQLAPLSTGRGADLKALLRHHAGDTGFAEDIASVRDVLETEARP